MSSLVVASLRVLRKIDRRVMLLGNLRSMISITSRHQDLHFKDGQAKRRQMAQSNHRHDSIKTKMTILILMQTVRKITFHIAIMQLPKLISNSINNKACETKRATNLAIHLMRERGWLILSCHLRPTCTRITWVGAQVMEPHFSSRFLGQLTNSGLLQFSPPHWKSMLISSHRLKKIV